VIEGPGECGAGGPDTPNRRAPTPKLTLVDAPGNVLLPKRASGLPMDSVPNVSQVVTLDRDVLTERAAKLSAELMAAVDAGLRLVFSP